MKVGQRVYTYNTIRKSIVDRTTEVRVGTIVSKKKGFFPFAQKEYVVKDTKGLHIHTTDTIYRYVEGINVTK